MNNTMTNTTTNTNINKAAAVPSSYEVVDIQTKGVVARCKTRDGASRSANRRDLSYGAVRYVVRAKY